MTITAELADGRRLEFPDGTDASVVQATVKKLIAGAAPAAPAPAAAAPEESDILRMLGLGGKAIFQGVTSLPTAFADVVDMPKSVASKVMGTPYEAPSARIQAAIDSVTDKPRTTEERLMTDALSGGSAALTGGPAKAITALSGAAGGLGGGVAREAGGGPLAQIVAAIVGGLVPSGTQAVGKTVGRIVDNAVVPGGATRSAIRATANIVPDKDAVADALIKAKPGQTAGQAAASTGNAEFAALEDIARKNAPTAFQSVDDAQQATRAATIRGIAKTPQELEAAKAARKAAADTFYDAARSTKGIDATPVAAKLDKLIGENPGNRELLTELKNIRAGLIANRKTGDLHTDGQKLASVLDGMKAAMSDEKNKFILANLTEIKDDLRALIPGMKQADAVFAKRSGPINKMVAGAELEKALTSGTGKERALPFTNAVENATRIPELRRRTGAQRFGSLDEVLDPAEMGKVKGVAEELQTDVRAADLARAGAPKVGQSYHNTLEGMTLPQVLSRPVMVANAIIRRLEGAGSKRTTDELSRLMLPPNVKTYGELVKKYGKDDARKIVTDAVIAATKGGIGQQNAAQE